MLCSFIKNGAMQFIHTNQSPLKDIDHNVFTPSVIADPDTGKIKLNFSLALHEGARIDVPLTFVLPRITAYNSLTQMRIPSEEITSHGDDETYILTINLPPEVINNMTVFIENWLKPVRKAIQP